MLKNNPINTVHNSSNVHIVALSNVRGVKYLHVVRMSCLLSRLKGVTHFETPLYLVHERYAERVRKKEQTYIPISYSKTFPFCFTYPENTRKINYEYEPVLQTRQFFKGYGETENLLITET